MEHLKKKIRTVPNFPHPGIMFRDITTLLQSAEALKEVTQIFHNQYEHQKIDFIVGIESRGFIFGTLIAVQLGVAFVPARKPGKLPARKVSVEYQLEYGTDTLEMHEDGIIAGSRVLVVDDLIATGGTAKATCELVEKVGGEVAGCAFVIELPELGGRKMLEDYPMYSIMQFEGE